MALLAGLAHAHLGNENNTEVRIYADRMQVVTRTSIPFAWRLLGDRAPAVADEAGKALARPLLMKEAPDLFTVTAGGKPLSPNKVDCQFEVENDAAFVLTYPRPLEWPVALTATFFDTLTNLDSGTVTVFDFKESRFNSDLNPIAEGVIHQGKPTLTFSLEGVAAPPTGTPVPLRVETIAADLKESRNPLLLLVLPVLLTLAVAIWWLRCRGRT